jgi:hypothetical protein
MLTNMPDAETIGPFVKKFNRRCPGRPPSFVVLLNAQFT